MAKKSKKIEKETRRLIEAVSDIVKKKNNRYKFKGVKKKEIRKIKTECVHWIIRKGKEQPAVEELSSSPGFWTCKICNKSFPIGTLPREEYHIGSEEFLAMVNQVFFYSVKMGGDASDTKVFLKLKELIPKFDKISSNLIKQLNKRQEFENRRQDAEINSQFSNYSSYSYRT